MNNKKFMIASGAKVGVIGYGSWATAIVKMLIENEDKVYWNIAKQDYIDYIKENKTNPRYLQSVHFPTECLDMSTDINYVVENSDILIFVTPSIYLKDTLSSLTVPMKDKFIVSAIKGIVPQDNITIAEYFNQNYDVPFDQLGIIVGPCHAEEVALERLSYLTVVCKDQDNAAAIAKKITCKYISVSTSTDIYGAEYAAVLKNIYAIAVGMCIGLRYGDNFTAVLIANATMEMSRFMENTYPYERNILASAYLGDLLVTTYSAFSRNRTFGVMIGKGYSIRSAQMEMTMVAEGYYASECIQQINQKYNVDMPIANAVYEVLYQKKPAAATIKELAKQLI
ncbi:MAG: NAD(P)H-dependent glycerol-3-phosphate dehydrogenase [Rikenellaceae bacterium]